MIVVPAIPSARWPGRDQAVEVPRKHRRGHEAAPGLAGLTTTQVSQPTRIRETIIRGIESDDSACGADFYARGPCAPSLTPGA